MWQKRYKGEEWFKVEEVVALAGLEDAYDNCVALMRDMKTKGYSVGTAFALYRWTEASDG